MPKRICDIMDGKTNLSREQCFGEGDTLELTVNYWHQGMLDHINRQRWRIVRPGSYDSAEAELVQEQAVAPHGFE